MPSEPSIEKQIQLALEILKQGGIVAFPTDTVYGLGADPLNTQAVEKIYRVKRRPQTLPLPLLVADKPDLSKVAAMVPELAWQLAEHFLPGGLTLVLTKGPWVPSIVSAGGDTIAVRIPNHQITIALIQGLGAPIIGTSANLSGKPSPVTAREVREQLGKGVDLIIDGGRCPGGLESTVIDVSSNVPVLIRAGAVPRREIEKVCGFPLGKS
ncbi:MAG TPA: threonylcarbamoyl-AMP synthase [Dehalococcoidia bacterium]|nr:threonylcarbamoyl-AMP synthase [Dehalococcoidia bacterium]